MQLAVLYIPVLQAVFKTSALSCSQWLIILLLSGVKLWWKFILYTFNRLFVWRLDYVKINS
jgi:hypothetical protein